MSYDQRHGGPWDRGSADAHYQRPYEPHYFKGDTYQSQRVNQQHMTQDEIAAYTAGFEQVELVQ